MWLITELRLIVRNISNDQTIQVLIKVCSFVKGKYPDKWCLFSLKLFVDSSISELKLQNFRPKIGNMFSQIVSNSFKILILHDSSNRFCPVQVNGGTRLSPWLAFGCISARMVVKEAALRNGWWNSLIFVGKWINLVGTTKQWDLLLFNYCMIFHVLFAYLSIYLYLYSFIYYLFYLFTYIVIYRSHMGFIYGTDLQPTPRWSWSGGSGVWRGCPTGIC